MAVKRGARVGAAAFVLGVSLVGPQAAGVAFADSSGADSAGSDSAHASPGSRPDTPAHRGRARAGSASKAETEPADIVPGSRGAAPAAALSPAANRTSNDSPTIGTSQRSIAVGVTTAPPTNVAPASPAPVAQPAEATVQPATSQAVRTVVAPASSVAGDLMKVAATGSGVSAIAPAASAAAEPRIPVITRLQVISQAVGSLATMLANALQNGADAPGPSLWAMAAWVRREFDYTFGKRAASAAPIQIGSSDASGLVFGTLNAVGPAKDPVSYDVVAGPSRGTVAIADNGIFTYTPNPDLAATGGADAFSVRIADTSFHLQNLLGIPNNSVDVAVPVLVSAPQGGTTTPAPVFRVVNLTSQAVRYAGGDINGKWSTLPQTDMMIQPGQEALFGVDPASVWSASGKFGFVVDPTDDTEQQYWRATFLSGSGIPFSGCTGMCTPPGLVDGIHTVYLLDPPDTVATLSGDKAQEQSDILNAFCASSTAQCSFTAKGQPQAVYGNRHLPTGFSPVINRTDQQVTTTVTMADSVGTVTSYSVKVSVAAELFKIIKTLFEAQYGQTINETHTFTQSITVSVKPGTQASIYVSQPMYRISGDYTVRFGNTTYLLKDVTIDIPNPTGNGVYEVVADPAPPIATV